MTNHYDAIVLGGVQSMFTAAWDEPFALPSEESATLALRTQQILAYETGVARVADPLGGSYYVEALTDEMEQAIAAVIQDIDGRGGFVEALRAGWVQRRIAERARALHVRRLAGAPLRAPQRHAGHRPPLTPPAGRSCTRRSGGSCTKTAIF